MHRATQINKRKHLVFNKMTHLIKEKKTLFKLRNRFNENTENCVRP